MPRHPLKHRIFVAIVSLAVAITFFAQALSHRP